MKTSVRQTMIANGKPVRGRTRILTDSVGKRNRKEILANNNKTGIPSNKTVGWN
jgi:hypothetical protein